jgi:hypothetical protein
VKRNLPAEAAFLLALGLGCSTTRVPRPMGPGDVRQIAVATSHGPLEIEYVTPLAMGPTRATGILRVDRVGDDETLIFGGPGMAPAAVPRRDLRSLTVTRRGRGAAVGAGAGVGLGVIAGIAVGFAEGASSCGGEAILCFNKPALAFLLAIDLGTVGGLVGTLVGLAVGGRDRYELAP